MIIKHRVPSLLAWAVILIAVFALGAAVLLSTVPEMDPTPAITHRVRNVNTNNVNEPVTMIAVGDVMLGRYVETLMNKNGVDYPFEKIRDAFKGADRVIANLEGPIVTDHHQTPDNSLIFSFPSQTAQTLKNNGITTVTLANNHALDRGVEGHEQTKQYLDDAGILHFGSPRAVSVDDVLMQTINGRDFSFFGFQAVSQNFDIDDATALLAKFPDTFAIVQIHWGNEYQTSPSSGQTTIARALVEAGADLVIGHHPHVVQRTETYNGRLIVFSLGNFIFDQYFSPETQNASLLRFTVTDDRLTATLTPLKSKNSQPAIDTAFPPEQFELLLR